MKKLRDLYSIEQLPIFQNRMYDTEAEAIACPKGDVRLVEDLRTGLVYNASFRPDLMVYDEHYQNEQAVSTLFQEHLEFVTKIIERTMGRDNLVEVGCGKGYFLELLLQHGFDITGFDPAYEGSNTRIARHYFEPSLGIKASGLILRHVLEHIKEPVDFLMSLKDANGGKGLIYIEVPDFDWICSKRAWFDIFYEHANYFRLADFDRMFDHVVESGTVFGKQYLYVVVELASLKIPEYDEEHHVEFPEDFIHLDLEQNRTEQNRTEQNRTEQNSAAIWGGASKGVIFSLLKKREGIHFNTVIDINSAKQGKFLPSTGLQVQSPADALSKLSVGSDIWVMNSNYLDEIKKLSGNTYNYICIDHE